MFPNPTCKISNYIIEPDSGLYNLYLSPEMQTESGIKRCLAAAETVKEIISYINIKQGDLHDTDILIEFLNDDELKLQYAIVNNNSEGIFTLYEIVNNNRNQIDKDENIDSLILRHTDKNLILQF
jgi:hypothetical protein